jgi:RNA polymerase sigma-70 factor (ECF subfamily)
MGGGDDAVPIAELLEERRYLLDVAYWMLGSGRAAESVVVEVYRRWYALSESARAGIVSPRAWLAKVAGGVCLDRLALPGRGAGGGGVEERLLQEVGGVLLGALDALSPVERAAFVLNDVFGMTPGAVADIVGQSERECVELAERARRSVRARRVRPLDVAEHDAVARRVRHACVAEDVVVLASLLAPDVTAFFDGGGKVRALVEPVHGSERVARSLLGLLARCPRTTVHAQSVNGRTGLVVRYDRQVAAVIGLDITGGRVVQVWVILNPDKLRSWNRTGGH